VAAPVAAVLQAAYAPSAQPHRGLGQRRLERVAGPDWPGREPGSVTPSIGSDQAFQAQLRARAVCFELIAKPIERRWPPPFVDWPVLTVATRG
jgi:hypothetical protein